jgi:hypothetical protein
MRTIIAKWAYSPKSVYNAFLILILAMIAAFCLGFIASWGRDLATETDIETIIANQLIQLIPFVVAGFVMALIHSIGTLPLFLLAGRYILICFNVVWMWSRNEAFGDLTRFSVILFALSPPGLLIGFSGIQLLLWHWRFTLQSRQLDLLSTTNN